MGKISIEEVKRVCILWMVSHLFKTTYACGATQFRC